MDRIRKAATFNIVIDFFDALNGVWTTRPMTYAVTDAWRRGFTIAIGVCEGNSQRGPGQLAVYQTLAEEGGRDGFDAGQAVQFDRTLHGDLGNVSEVAILKTDRSLLGLQQSVPNFVGLSPTRRWRSPTQKV